MSLLAQNALRAAQSMDLLATGEIVDAERAVWLPGHHKLALGRESEEIDIMPRPPANRPEPRQRAAWQWITVLIGPTLERHNLGLWFVSGGSRRLRNFHKSHGQYETQQREHSGRHVDHHPE